jgi:PAS domain S-box-containing protein
MSQAARATLPPLEPGDEPYRLLVDSVHDYAIFMLDPGGIVVTWNTGGQRLTGFTPDEIIGRHYSVFYTPDAISCGWPEYELDTAARDGRFEDEGWRVRKDGTRFWANLVITALRWQDGSLRGFAKIARDLTERRLHDEALRRSEERYRLMVSGIKDYAIFMLDADGRIVSWNSGAQKILGYTSGEVLGRYFDLVYRREDFSDAGAELNAARTNGRSEEEGWRVRKDGTRFWANSIMTTLYDSQGELCGFAKVVRDLTEHQRERGSAESGAPRGL